MSEIEARDKPTETPSPAGDDRHERPPQESERSAQAEPVRAPRRRRLRRILLLGGPLLVALLAAYLYVTGGRYVGTENAYVKADKVAIGAEVAGRIASIPVAENEHVTRDQVLFRIDPRPFRIALAKAEANLSDLRAELAGLKTNYTQKQEELDLAVADRRFAEREYQRQADLAKRQVASQTRLDEAQHQVVAAKQRISVARQQLAQLRAQLGGDPDLPVEQQPRFQEAQAARDQAALDLEHTAVRAPFAGVASNTPERGQLVQVGAPVMSLVADRDVWIEANFKETALTYVRPGQPVDVHIDTYPDRHWHGTVQSLSPATGAEFSVLPAQNSTGNWVKVVQRIPVRIAIQAQPDAPPLRAGMSTQVEIDTGHHRPLPAFARSVVDWFGGGPAQARTGAH